MFDLKSLCLRAMVVGSLSFLPATAEERPPNVVVFLVDDIGWGDVGCYGSQLHETPAIDTLAKEGMKFTHGYSACTVCSPSRAAIITGQYPARLHLTDWIAGHVHAKAKLQVPDWKMYIDHSLTTIPEALKSKGYATGFFGKWHLMPHKQPELMPEHTPVKHGFDINVGGREWGQPKGKGKYFYPWDMPGLEGGAKGDFLTDRLTTESIKWIDGVKEKPFLLYLSYYAVHGPIMTKPELKKKYQAKLKAGDFKQKNAAYAGMIQSVDESVGRVMDYLKKNGLADNTLVIFTGDNGGVAETSSGGLRKGKAWSYEGGTREPFIMKWAGKVKAGSSSDTPVIGMDIYPTILEAAGVSQPKDQACDGISLVSHMEEGATIDRDTLYWHYPHYHKTKPYSAIRKGNWKLIRFHEDGKLELYHLRKDPSESQNLSSQFAEKAKTLAAELDAWLNSVDAQHMTPNPAYDPKAGKRGQKGKRK
ncbi:sulfatase [Verrucomicrobiaceae bacterium R5-34]|nr:sulfatase [Verrucomicrobiaceae bacterium R5-34]